LYDARERELARSVTGGDEFGERQFSPAVAARAVGSELVAMLMNSGNVPGSITARRYPALG
jgi:hypothetical protein